jgi:hypothetical protein
MADKKISELTALTTPDGTEELVVNDGGTSKKITAQNLIQWNKGADVGSATALPVLTDGNYFDVTGTTTVTSINTTGGAGTVIKLHFDAILILTHHATDLYLPGGANITTAVGDEAEFIEYATGDYRCTNYSKASGNSPVNSLPLAGGTMTGTIATFTSTGIDDNATSTAITIDSSENVSVGASSIMQNFGSNRTTLAVKGVGTDNYSSLQLGNGGSTTSGKYHGFVNFYNNNTSVARVASISNSNAVDADLTFFTAPSGGGIQERLRLTSDGRGLSQFTAKVWVHFNGTGTVAIRDSHNVSSITDIADGKYTLNFSNNLANDDYAVTANSEYVYTTARMNESLVSSTEVWTRASNQVFADASYIAAVIFGD